MRRSFIRVRVSNNLRINHVSVQTQRKASQIAHHQKYHKHTNKMLNFTTLHSSKFQNAKLQKKVGLCNTPCRDTRFECPNKQSESQCRDTRLECPLNRQVEKKHNHLSLTKHRTRHAVFLHLKLPKTQMRNPL